MTAGEVLEELRELLTEKVRENQESNKEGTMIRIGRDRAYDEIRTWLDSKGY